MSQNMNQFKQTPVVGSLDLQSNPNPSMFTCRFKDASETAGTTMVPGEGAKLIDLDTADFISPPIVDERALVSDPIFGVKVYTTKKNAAVDNDIVQVAGRGAVVFMNAGAAIVRGAEVSLVLATPGNVVTLTAGSRLGVCLDKATAANQLVRVLIDPLTVAT